MCALPVWADKTSTMKQYIQNSNLLSTDTLLLLLIYLGSVSLFFVGKVFLTYQPLLLSGFFIISLSGGFAVAASVFWVKKQPKSEYPGAQ